MAKEAQLGINKVTSVKLIALVMFGTYSLPKMVKITHSILGLSTQQDCGGPPICRKGAKFPAPSEGLMLF